MNSGDISLIRTRPIKVIYLSKKGRLQDVNKSFKELFDWANDNNIEIISNGIGVFYNTLEESNLEETNYDVCYPIVSEIPVHSEIKTGVLPSEEMAAIIHRGPYDIMLKTYEKAVKWIIENDFRIKGPSRWIYITCSHTPGNIEPDDYITEIQFPILKVRDN